MYPTTAPLDLDYLNEQLLPRRYESEEEEASESELGAHDHAFSPVKTAGPFDSDPSDELSNANSPESPVDKAFARLLPAYPSGKQSRPVSLDTVKRSSGTTFVPDSYIFDDDDDVIIELPSPTSTSPLQSPIFLQPTVYQPPASPRSPSPALADLDEETDVLVAEQVTFVEPSAKPNLILISPVTDSPVVEEPEPMSAVSVDVPDRFPPRQGLYSLNQGTKSQPMLSDKRSDHLAHMKRGSLQLHGKYAKQTPRRAETDPFTTPRMMLADVPETSQPTTSLRSRAMTWNRPQTSAESASNRGPQAGPLRRPPSMQNVGGGGYTLFPSTRRTPAYPGDEFHARSSSLSYSIASSEFSLPPSRTSSPAPYYSSPTFNRHRSGSNYSVSSVPGNIGQRPPVRHSMMKSSTAPSVYSASSLRSEVESVYSMDPREVAEPDAKAARRKKSFRRSKQPPKIETTEPPLPTTNNSTKSFMGFMLRGRRKSTIQKSNA